MKHKKGLMSVGLRVLFIGLQQLITMNDEDEYFKYE